MNKLIPFSQISKSAGKLSLLSNASVVVDDRGVPVGFFLGRETLVSLMTVIDEQFEEKVSNTKDTYDNFAGKIIDFIEEKLPVNPKFTDDLNKSIREAKEEGWAGLEEIKRTLNV